MKKMSATNILSLLGRESAAWLIFGVAASFLLSFFEIALGSTLQLLIGKLSQGPDVVLIKGFEFLKKFSLGELCIILSCVGLARGIIQIFTSQSGHIFDIILNSRLRNLTIYDLLISKRDKSIAASDINLRFSEIFPKSGSFISVLTFGAVALIQVSMVGAACVALNWKLSLFGLFSIVISGSMLLLFRKKVLQISRYLIEEQTAVSKLLQKLTRNWIFIKISRTGEAEYESLLKRLRTYYSHSKMLGFIIKACGVFPTVLGIAVISTMIFSGYTYFNLRGAEIVGFTYLFYRFIQQFTSIIDSASGVTNYFPHFSKSFDFFNSIDPEDRAIAFNYFQKSLTAKNNTKIERNFQAKAPSVKIQNLDYAWETGPLLFNQFNLEIPSSSIFGIVGASGTGKSTLLSLILGVLHPTRGKILINGKAPEKFFDLFSDCVGYVGAEPFLNEGSVKDNLIYGLNPDRYSEEKIQTALKLAQLQEFCDKLDYPITENGEGLSSGQKQRLSLARAFMKNPKLLILDEATSNLDSENERLIANILKEYKNDCTIIIVSHRPGILIHADYTYSFETQNTIGQNTHPAYQMLNS